MKAFLQILHWNGFFLCESSHYHSLQKDGQKWLISFVNIVDMFLQTFMKDFITKFTFYYFMNCREALFDATFVKVFLKNFCLTHSNTIVLFTFSIVTIKKPLKRFPQDHQEPIKTNITNKAGFFSTFSWIHLAALNSHSKYCLTLSECIQSWRNKSKYVRRIKKELSICIDFVDEFFVSF